MRMQLIFFFLVLQNAENKTAVYWEVLAIASSIVTVISFGCVILFASILGMYIKTWL